MSLFFKEKSEFVHRNTLFKLGIAAFILSSIACSHLPHSSHSNSAEFTPLSAAQEQAWNESELIKNNNRLPSQTPHSDDLTQNYSMLRKVSPGKFQVFVFPKISNITAKLKTQDDLILGPPQVFEFSLIAESPCQQFIQKKLQANLEPQQFFPNSLLEGDHRCAIMEVTDMTVRKLPSHQLRQGDILSYRIFLDDSYQVYGTDVQIANSDKKWENRRLKLAARQPLSSGLSLFPIDLPLLPNWQQAQRTQLNPQQQGLDELGVHQIQRKYMKNFSVTTCEGSLLNYKDMFGRENKIGWCKQQPWPLFTENSRFLSITQPLSQKK